MRDNGLHQSVVMDIDKLDEIENGIDGSLAKFAQRLAIAHHGKNGAAPFLAQSKEFLHCGVA